MNLELLEKAREKVPSVPILVNMASRRVKQLVKGMRPYVKPLSQDEDRLDIALREIAEGKIIAEVDLDAIKKEEDSQSDWAL